MSRQILVVVACSVVHTAITALRLGLSWPSAVAGLLTVLVLWRAMEQSRLSGRELGLALSLVYFGVSFLNTLAEAVLFEVVPASQALSGIAGGALTAFAVIGCLIMLSGRWKLTPSRTGSVATLKNGLPWRIFLLALCYCALYVAAGIAIHPLIHEFYAGRRLPALPELLAIQFVRGTLYLLVTLPWLRLAAGRRRELTLSLGLVFSVLGGLAPLLLAAEFMPPAIRLAHAAEVGASNFLFGVITGFVLLADGNATIQPRQARMSWITLPNTSVRRKSRPL